MPKNKTITPEQLAWLEQCEPIRAVDIRAMGLPAESNHEVEDMDDLLDLFEGIDSEGRAL